MDSTVSRRTFFKVSGATAAGAAAVAIPGIAEAAPAADAGRTTLPYPRKPIGKVSGLKVNEPVAFQPAERQLNAGEPGAEQAGEFPRVAFAQQVQ